MNDRKTRVLVTITAFVFLLAGAILFYVFELQGMGKNKTSSYIDYNVNDYVEISPVIFNSYGDVYSNINVSRVDIKKLDNSLFSEFIKKEEQIIQYITDYYEEIHSNDEHTSMSVVSSTIKTQIYGAVLSIFYRLDFNLDESVFENNIKSYFISTSIDLATNKVLTNDDLLSKYNYTRDYISDKLFNEEVLTLKGQIVIDKETHLSLTQADVERKKDEYVKEIIFEFDNIIEMYIDNGTLVLVYDSKELKNIFFDNKFDSKINFKYLK